MYVPTSTAARTTFVMASTVPVEVREQQHGVSEAVNAVVLLSTLGAFTARA
jgi:hypothetical protein